MSGGFAPAQQNMNAELPITLERCAVSISYEIDPDKHIVVVQKQAADHLNEQELHDYKSNRIQFLSWLLNVGKDPESAAGYSPYTVYSTANRTALFERWVWEQHGKYVHPPDEEDATDFMEHLAYSDKGEVAKGKLQEGIKRLSKWLQHERGYDEWEFEYKFDGSGGNLEPRDFLSKKERRDIRLASLNHEGKFEEVGETDGWKIASLVQVSLDAGLRPAEVSNATTEWVDKTKGALRIPHQESTKNQGNWLVSLTDRTMHALEEWLQQREQIEAYSDTDLLWLTRRENPYGSKSLARLLRRLCDEAEIEYENRQMSWYIIRHSVGTHLTEEKDLKATKDQLRHRSAMTTMKYRQVSVEDRREGLDRIG